MNSSTTQFVVNQPLSVQLSDLSYTQVVYLCDIHILDNLYAKLHVFLDFIKLLEIEQI